MNLINIAELGQISNLVALATVEHGDPRYKNI